MSTSPPAAPQAEGGNRLAAEPSPYLQQHASNPVDWFPWGKEAFEEARRRDVPVFVSIGYATCHWCHIMAHESFEDPGVALLMNDAFVNVKVDREERPDVDEAYMAVCQAMTGSGGWPLTVLLTPDKRPFFAGTYFPKASRHGRIGMMDLVPRIQELWQQKREELVRQADHALEHAAASTGAGRREAASPGLGEAALEAALDGYAARFDPRHAGFGGAPKFPSPHNLMLLLRLHARREGKDAKEALPMVVRTLHAMADGGVHDQIGGGFHRYATDAQWLLPHFEKMLYDQAMLALAYTEAWLATGDGRLAEVARSTLDYVLRDLQDPAGGLRCAEDADSEGEEGKFYVWTRPEILEALGPELGALACDAFGVLAEGNFRDEATRQRTGANVLHVARPLEALASAHGLTAAQAQASLDAARRRLFERRARRVRPLLDGKVLTDWNGLAIAALAKAGAALDEPRYLKAARRAADFLLSRMRLAGGRLCHRYKDGARDSIAFLDDHAFLLWSLLELHAADGDPRWLVEAAATARELRERFAAPGGGFWLAPKDGEDLGIRRLEAYDGALPSGNSAAAYALARLGWVTGDEGWTQLADRTLAAFAPQLESHPHAFAMLLCALDLRLGPTREVVVAGNGPEADRMARLAARGFQPRTLVVRASPGLARVAPWTRDHVPLGGLPTAYVCEGYACKRPVTGLAGLEAALSKP